MFRDRETLQFASPGGVHNFLAILSPWEYC